MSTSNFTPPFNLLSLGAELGQAAAAALRGQFSDSTAIPAELGVQPASRPEFGDLQIAGCLQLAKPLSKKPRDLAQIVADRLRSDFPAVLEKVEIAGAGYVNLFLSARYIESCLEALAADARHGIRRRFADQRVIVDYSSPNIAKPMHIAHIRSTIIGDALTRIMRAVGYDVIADNHLGDWGTQFGKLIVAYRRWLDKDHYQSAPIAELVRLYQKFVIEEMREAEAKGIRKPDRKADASDSEAEGEDSDTAAPEATDLLKQARAELAKLQSGDLVNKLLWHEFVTVSLAEFERTYKRLGVKFDYQLGESFYNPRLTSLVEELLQKGIAEQSRGAVICPVEGEPAPLLVRKADGSFLYGTTDLATIELRIKVWNPVRILYVVGAPQMMHFRQVFSVARKMGVQCSLEHITFGSMRFQDDEGNWSTGSTRKGNVPLLDEFLDSAVEKANHVAQAKSPELAEKYVEFLSDEIQDRERRKLIEKKLAERFPHVPISELDNVARVVGIGAVKYNDLARDRQADIHFDFDKALAFEGNTAPYLQYAYARMHSIQRRAEFEGVKSSTPRLIMPAERALGRSLLDYGAAVERAAETARPHTLCEYLYELSVAVSTFYNEVQVLKAEPAERASRLALLDLAARTLKHGLSLLGIEVPERM